MVKIKEILLVVVLVLPLIMMSSCSVKKSDNQLIVVEETSDSNDTYEDIYDEIYVYIVGEVVNPGVYVLNEGARINEAVQIAGGFTDKAAIEYINLASKLSDGEKIVVYSKEQVDNNEIMTEAGSQLVNINTADVERLMTLPGIGESKAKDIINYREKNGGFSTKEDIMKVPGIKEAAFSKIEDLITIN